MSAKKKNTHTCMIISSCIKHFQLQFMHSNLNGHKHLSMEMSTVSWKNRPTNGPHSSIIRWSLKNGRATQNSSSMHTNNAKNMDKWNGFCPNIWRKYFQILFNYFSHSIKMTQLKVNIINTTDGRQLCI